MIIDANEQSAYAVIGVPLAFISAEFVLVAPVTPGERIITVAADSRSIIVSADNRSTAV